ncbi:MAG: 5-formyltetrahydrofolate cyclo-ligase [Fulvivirga sp.]|nr:5-formyltetrahydrofolate cyclo-ligase [Fulvivirga sp.]
MVDKSILRNVFLEKRLFLSQQEHQKRNKLLAENLFARIDISQYKCMHTFLSITDKKEVDTHAIIDKAVELNDQLQVVISKTKPKGILEHYLLDHDTVVETNNWGIPEPINGKLADISKIDLILVPLITFDKVGHRIGYGKGYYDRFLKQVPTATKIGLSLTPPLDLIQYIESNDVKMDACVTPFELYSF